MKKYQKYFMLSLACLLFITVFLAACTKDQDKGQNPVQNAGEESPKQSDKEANEQSSEVKKNFIADRHINGRIFLSSEVAELPDDQINNPIAQKIKEETGITLEWYGSGLSSLGDLTTTLATGEIPEIITNYLDHGGRPEMAVLLKAAREEMFLDLRPYLEDTKVLKKYLDPDFLPRDTRDNIMFRPDFDGAVYFIHLNIPTEDRTDDERWHGRAGLYIKKDIVDALNIDVSSIKTQDDLYELAVKIKEGDFKDLNGNPVIPIGPRYWGGQPVSYLWQNYDFGNGTRFDMDTDGLVKHVAETDYPLKTVEFVRRLLSEGLLDQEAFNMDSVRVQEGMFNGSYAISAHWQIGGEMFEGDSRVKYVPLDQMYNWKGEDAIYEKEKSGYKTWSISSKAKNPEEIVKFVDYLVSQEGKTLWTYGIEGKDYTIEDGKYIFTEDYMDFKRKQPELLKNRVPTYWGSLLGSTNRNDMRDFGELVTGMNTEPEKYSYMMEMQTYGNPMYKYWDGYSALSFLSDLPTLELRLKPVLDNYADTLVKAFYARSSAEAEKVITDYRDSLYKAGVDEFKDFLQLQHTKDPKSVAFYINANF